MAVRPACCLKLLKSFIFYIGLQKEIYYKVKRYQINDCHQNKQNFPSFLEFVELKFGVIYGLISVTLYNNFKRENGKRPTIKIQPYYKPAKVYAEEVDHQRKNVGQTSTLIDYLRLLHPLESTIRQQKRSCSSTASAQLKICFLSLLLSNHAR